MNKLLTLILVCLTVSFSHAQKTKVTAAGTYLSSGEVKEAKEYIDMAFSDPDVATMAKAWMTKGEVYNAVHQMADILQVEDAINQADEAFRKAYQLDMAAEKKAGRYKSRISAGMLNTITFYFQHAVAAYNEGDYQAALDNFKASSDAAGFMLNNTLVDADDEDVNNLKVDALQNGALCAINLQDYDAAEKIYNTLISHGSADERVYANLASILISKESFEEAKVIIDQGLAAYPDNESLKESELNYFIGSDQSDKAIGKLIEAVDEDPTDPDLYFNLALAYDKKGEKDKMVETYEKIMEVDPTYAPAYLNLGAYYNEKANDVIRTMNEMTDWKEAIKMEPERNKWYNTALPYLEKAYELLPDEEGVARALERIYANLNMLDKIEEMKKE